ncbi:MAG: hypothetical protein ACLQVY_26855 [Limisphaerales bacterium]
MAAQSNGAVAAWGASPSLPTGVGNVVAVAAGEYHSLAITSSGTVLDWGANHSGEGIVPAGLSNVVALAAGWSYSLALCASASVSGSLQLLNPVWTSNTFSVALLSQSERFYRVHAK